MNASLCKDSETNPTGINPLPTLKTHRGGIFARSCHHMHGVYSNRGHSPCSNRLNSRQRAFVFCILNLSSNLHRPVGGEWQRRLEMAGTEAVKGAAPGAQLLNPQSPHSAAALQDHQPDTKQSGAAPKSPVVLRTNRSGGGLLIDGFIMPPGVRQVTMPRPKRRAVRLRFQRFSCAANAYGSSLLYADCGTCSANHRMAWHMPFSAAHTPLPQAFGPGPHIGAG